MNFTVIILAGGRSSRMGSNKALVKYLDKPLIRYSIELALQFTTEIMISANTREFDHFGYPVVGDRFPVKAPLAGIHAGLWASKTPWNLILTCDMPLVTKELIDYLVSKLKDESGLLVPGHDGYIEPLCGFYHQKLLPEIEANIKQGKLSPLDLIAGVKEGVADVYRLPGADPASLFKNVNTISDLT